MTDKATPEDIGYFLRFTLEPNELVTNYTQHLKSFEDLYSQAPSSYGWRYTPVSAFTKNISKARSALDINAAYWTDLARSAEAYNIQVLWRGGEVLRAAKMCLHTGTDDVLGAAILSRSLIELTCSFVIHGSKVRQSVAEVPFGRKADTVLGSDLEELLNKALFGTRLVDKDNAAHQTNILTLIKKVSDVPGFEPVFERYERLCEVAHPNVLGSATFWSGANQGNADGSETRLLKRDDRSSSLYMLVLADAIWGVAWSAVNLRQGFLLIQEQIRTIREEFPGAGGSLAN